MKRFLAVFMIYLAQSAEAQTAPIQLEDVYISSAEDHRVFTRLVYSVEHTFSAGDTVLFLRRVQGLEIARVDSISRHELAIQFIVADDFFDFATHTAVVFDSAMNPKLHLSIDLISRDSPLIEQVLFIDNSRISSDTLLINQGRKSLYSLCLRGQGLYRNSMVHFDDPAIKVKSESGRFDRPPCEMQFSLEIDPAELELGQKYFRISNPFSQEGWAQAFFKASQPPRIISTVNSFTADGRQQVIELQGMGFSRGLEVQLEPNEAVVHSQFISAEKIQVRMTLPMLEESKSYRLIVRNRDGQADTLTAFIARAMPMATAHAVPLSQPTIFTGQPVIVLFTVDTRDGRRLSKQNAFEVNIDGERFPITRVHNDSTCEAEILIKPDRSSALPNRHVFTINQVDRSPSWRGTFNSRQPPIIDYVSHNRVLHPSDSLGLIIKGRNLKNAQVLIEEPEVNFLIIESRDDLLRLAATAGAQVTLGKYPLELRIDDVAFRFDAFAIEIKPWQPFSDYVSFHISSVGELDSQACFRGLESQHQIKAQDVITVRIDARRIREQFGVQKIIISGVLTDSSSTVRAEAFDNRMLTAAAGDEEITWRWRVRERVRSGDRIEITLRNPGNHNRITEYFLVTPHWSEAFHGSTSFVLFKLPFGSTEEKTQILNSIGIGISYQPLIKRRFLEFDASFIVGNVKSEKNDFAVEVSLGLSAIFWQHLQIGIGSNLTGSTFSKGFMFVGTRFKLPISL